MTLFKVTWLPSSMLINDRKTNVQRVLKATLCLTSILTRLNQKAGVTFEISRSNFRFSRSKFKVTLGHVGKVCLHDIFQGS